MKLNIYRCSCERKKVYVIFKTPKNAIYYYKNNKAVAHLCKSCMEDSFQSIHDECGNFFFLEGVRK